MISKVFKSRIQSCNFAFKDGTLAYFIGGTYTTYNEAYIAELMAEIKNVGKTASMHPQLYVDEDNQEMDSEALTPFELLKAAAKKEALAELAASGQMSDVQSTSDTSGFNASLTNSVSAGSVSLESNGAILMAGTSASAGLVAKLAGLKK